MKKYDVEILTKLIDKYERSVISKSGSKKKIRVFIKANDSIFKDYWSDTSYLYRDKINYALNKLSDLGYIKNDYDSNNEIAKVYLVYDKIDEIYTYLKRDNRKSKNEEIVKYLTDLDFNSILIRDFVNEIIFRLNNFKPVKSYFDNLDNLKLYIHAIDEMNKLEDDTLKRNFSKRIFNDSKLFERIENKVCKIIKDFSDIGLMDNEEILEKNHIIKTPIFVYIKGDMVIKVRNEIIDLKEYGHEIALSTNAVKDLKIIEIRDKKIITIENLTTFVAFIKQGYTSIYLGGFHNSIKRELLRKISNFENLEFYHFGDIDVGGLLIFDDLIKKTKINFKPYLMDIHTLKKHKDNWTRLTQNDRKRLELYSNPIFDDVVNYMLTMNCKLEQEALKID